jgi:hypothetical protein
MKKILLLGLSLFSLNTFSQTPTLLCNMECNNGNTVSFTGGLGNNSYNSDVCFTGLFPSATIANSTNWNNWNKLSFRSLDCTFLINKEINMNGNKKVYFRNDLTGTLRARRISMSGTDTIYCDENLEIQTLISNNSLVGNQANVIMLSSPTYSVKVNGIDYYNGDTIFTANNVGSNVLVKLCLEPPLSTNPLTLKVKNYHLVWKLQYPELVHVQGSFNGTEFIRLRTTSEDNYPIEGKYSFYRIKVGTQYSNIIKVIPLEESDYYYLNLQGQQVDFSIAPQGLYIKVYENGYREKVFK